MSSYKTAPAYYSDDAVINTFQNKVRKEIERKVRQFIKDFKAFTGRMPETVSLYGEDYDAIRLLEYFNKSDGSGDGVRAKRGPYRSVFRYDKPHTETGRQDKEKKEAARLYPKGRTAPAPGRVQFTGRDRATAPRNLRR